MATREAVVRLVIDNDQVAKAIAVVLDSAVVDDYCWLSGDDIGGVGVQCRACDRGGLPVAYLQGWGTSLYPPSEVPEAGGIFDLYVLANAHVQQHHHHGAQG